MEPIEEDEAMLRQFLADKFNQMQQKQAARKEYFQKK